MNYIFLKKDIIMSVNVEDILVFSNTLENGTYASRVIDVVPFIAKSGTEFVKVVVEITAGPAEGMEHDWLYNLTGYPNKKGGTNYPGLSNLKRDLTVLGLMDKMPKAWPTDPQLMTKTLGKALQGARFNVTIKDGKENAAGKSYKETYVAPIAPKQVAEDED